MDTVLQILDNLVFLSFLGIGFYFVERNRGSLGEIRTQVLKGLCFGFIAFLVTATPVTLGDGATIDARAGPVILAGIYAGPIGAMIAAVLGSIARGIVGGSFAPSGMVVYFVYAIFGIALARFRIVTPATVMTVRGLMTVAFASCVGASLMFLLIRPAERAIYWAQNDLPFILLANVLSVGYSAMVVCLAVGFVRKTTEAAELGETLKLARHAGRFGVWDFDLRSGVLKWDDRSRELHGIEANKFTGTYEDWSRNVHPEDLPIAQEAFTRALAGDAPFSVEYRVALPGNGTRTIKGDAVVLRNRAGAPVRVVGTNLDLTELRATEARLTEAESLAVQSQKFETIGKLTGGVAHDFNNLLAVIMGNQELLRDEIRRTPMDVDEATTLIDASVEATRRGADLTRNMLAYARKAQLTPVRTDLNEVVRETERWVRRTIESSVEIETVLQAGLWPTLVDRASIQSALVNLLVNARDALEGSGKVTVETSNVRVDRDYVRDRSEDIIEGRYVMLAVTDTGPGIPADMLDRIFDPFFTTKPTGKGSGLGLSMVQGFVKQSKGAIRVYTEVGVGTSFKLYFPAAQDAPIEDGAPDDAEAVPGDEGTSATRLLLVEDDNQLLSTLRKTLSGAGYKVVVAMSGDAALETFREDPDFDLVVTDIVMPGVLQGPALAKEIRALRPEMRFIFLSGYASEATVHGNGLRPTDLRLMKPVSRPDLLRAVETMLSGTGSPAVS